MIVPSDKQGRDGILFVFVLRCFVYNHIIDTQRRFFCFFSQMQEHTPFQLDIEWFDTVTRVACVELENTSCITFRDIRKTMQRQGVQQLFTSRMVHYSKGKKIQELTELNCDTLLSTYGIQSGDTLTFEVQEQHHDMPLICTHAIVPITRRISQHPMLPDFKGHTSDCSCEERKTLNWDRLPWISTTDRELTFVWDYDDTQSLSLSAANVSVGNVSAFERFLTVSLKARSINPPEQGWGYGEYELQINVLNELSVLFRDMRRVTINGIETTRTLTIPFQIVPAYRDGYLTLIESDQRVNSCLLMDLWRLVISFLVVG